MKAGFSAGIATSDLMHTKAQARDVCSQHRVRPVMMIPSI